MEADPTVGGKAEVGGAADTLLGTGEAPHAKQEIPAQKCGVILRHATGDDEAWRLDLDEHMGKDRHDFVDTAYFVERILEVGVVGIDRAKLRSRCQRQRFEESDDARQAFRGFGCRLHHRPVTLWIRAKYQRYGSSRAKRSQFVKRFGKWM